MRIGSDSLHEVGRCISADELDMAQGAHWEELMNRRTTSMLAGLVIATSPAFAAEVTPERLINADREPQNWLMNHRTYDAQRYSLLDKINRAM
jgi:glucose dehydrogenase